MQHPDTTRELPPVASFDLTWFGLVASGAGCRVDSH